MSNKPKAETLSLIRNQSAAICVTCELRPNGYDDKNFLGWYDTWTECAKEWLGINPCVTAETMTAEDLQKTTEKGYQGSLYFVQDNPVVGNIAQLVFMHLFETEGQALEYLKDDEFREMLVDFRKSFLSVTNQAVVYKSGQNVPG